MKHATLHAILVALMVPVAVRPEPAAGGQAQGPPQRPNIVFLLADDQRFDAMGCMGHPEIRTPQMDRLAAEGMAFLRHYDTSPICMASRASIMTGLYEYRHGCNFDRGSMGRGQFMRSYPVLLRRAGYRVGFAGKFGFPVTDEPTDSSAETPERLPVDLFDYWGGWVAQGFYETERNPNLARYAGRYPHVSRALGAAACDFIAESVAAGRPFCLSVSFKAPHQPHTPDPLDDGLYRDTTFPRPPHWGRAAGAMLPEQARRSRMYQSEFELWETEEGFQERMRLYHRLVHGNDAALGMIRDQLERLGVADNTVIIYTSDNGWMYGDRGLGGKVFPYEPSARAPLIIRDPRRPASRGRTCTALTGNIDMGPTILDLAGVAPPEGLDGVSLVPLLEEPGRAVREELVLMNAWPWSAEQMVMGVVAGRWKYLFWFYGEPGLEPAEELYDLQEDPTEARNLAAGPEPPEALKAMRERYDRLRAFAARTCIPGNSYPQWLRSADRAVPWTQKQWTAPPMARK